MITSKEIESVVKSFYDIARDDILIGYHFKRIADFDAHLPRIYAFWELQLIGKTARELETPLDAIRAHMPLRIHVGELNRWVKLFLEVLKASALSESQQELWRQKVHHFQQVFLKNPLLFSSSG